jgi:hypothetical protein
VLRLHGSRWGVNQRPRIAYEKAKAERGKLAAELKALYPQIEAKLRDILPTIATNDEQIENIINHSLPLGAERLLVAELVARDLRGFVENSVDVARITRQLRLPAFQFDRLNR